MVRRPCSAPSTSAGTPRATGDGPPTDPARTSHGAYAPHPRGWSLYTSYTDGWYRVRPAPSGMVLDKVPKIRLVIWYAPRHRGSPGVGHYNRTPDHVRPAPSGIIPEMEWRLGQLRSKPRSIGDQTKIGLTEPTMGRYVPCPRGSSLVIAGEDRRQRTPPPPPASSGITLVTHPRVVSQEGTPRDGGDSPYAAEQPRKIKYAPHRWGSPKQCISRGSQ